MALKNNPVNNGEISILYTLYKRIEVVKPKAAEIKTRLKSFILVLQS